MTPFRHVLVAHDFSAFADTAFERAVEIAARYGATLTVAHVYQPLVASIPEGLVLYSAAHFAEFMGQINDRLEQLRLRAVGLGATGATAIVRQGPPHVELCGYAREHSVDLIVVGSHGRTGVMHALVGSVAEKVVRKAPCPVLVVRSDAA